MIAPASQHTPTNTKEEYIAMQYNNLKSLLENSSGSRTFFFSLSDPIRERVQESGEYIHSASELRLYADLIEKYNRAVKISEMPLDTDWNKYSQ